MYAQSRAQPSGTSDSARARDRATVKVRVSYHIPRPVPSPSPSARRIGVNRKVMVFLDTELSVAIDIP